MDDKDYTLVRLYKRELMRISLKYGVPTKLSNEGLSEVRAEIYWKVWQRVMAVLAAGVPFGVKFLPLDDRTYFDFAEGEEPSGEYREFELAALLGPLQDAEELARGVDYSLYRKYERETMEIVVTAETDKLDLLNNTTVSPKKGIYYRTWQELAELLTGRQAVSVQFKGLIIGEDPIAPWTTRYKLTVLAAPLHHIGGSGTGLEEEVDGPR
ncbi:MAG TPA: hypothetical protein VGE45_00405 [Chloroflexia bacterium]